MFNAHFMQAYRILYKSKFCCKDKKKYLLKPEIKHLIGSKQYLYYDRMVFISIAIKEPLTYISSNQQQSRNFSITIIIYFLPHTSNSA